MTGTGRRRWLVGAGVIVAVAVGLTVWLIRGDGGDDGSDTTPIAQLSSVARLSELVDTGEPTDPAAPTELGAALGAAGARLTTPQELDPFRAEYGTGPRDLASQIGTQLAALATDVSPPGACGDRATALRQGDTEYVLQLAAAVATQLAPDAERAAAIEMVLPPALDDSTRGEVAAALAAGNTADAAGLVLDELGDRAARLVVGGVVGELAERLSAADGADYLADFTSAVNFVGNVDSVTDTCD